jgi:hypothetical protein
LFLEKNSVYKLNTGSGSLSKYRSSIDHQYQQAMHPLGPELFKKCVEIQLIQILPDVEHVAQLG